MWYNVSVFKRFKIIYNFDISKMYKNKNNVIIPLKLKFKFCNGISKKNIIMITTYNELSIPSNTTIDSNYMYFGLKFKIVFENNNTYIVVSLDKENTYPLNDSNNYINLLFIEKDD